MTKYALVSPDGVIDRIASDEVGDPGRIRLPVGTKPGWRWLEYAEVRPERSRDQILEGPFTEITDGQARRVWVARDRRDTA